MSSINEAQILGNLCADPEVKSFSNGGKVANLRVATNERWKDKNGEQQERVEYHSVAIFNEGLVGVVERYLKKGSKVYLRGQLQTRKWQNSAGEDRYSTEIVLRGFDAKLTMLDGKPAGDGSRGAADQGTVIYQSPDLKDELADEIPF